MEKIEIPFGDKYINGILETASAGSPLLIIAHGAGAPMTHSFMEKLSMKLLEKGINVLRFNFPYIDAGRKSPGSPKPNIAAWKAVVEFIGRSHDAPIYISGKSYGGRMGSHLLADDTELGVKGIIYFGFPLHAPGRDSKDRADHLTKLKVPQLFIQGTKDALANYGLIQEVVEVLDTATLVTIEDADHSFRVKGRKPEDIIEELGHEAAKWIKVDKTNTVNY